MSIRQIAAELDMSKSNVHRYLHTQIVKREEQQEFDPKQKWDYFPGCEEYEARANDPRFDDIDSRRPRGRSAKARGIPDRTCDRERKNQIPRKRKCSKVRRSVGETQKELIEEHRSTGVEIPERGQRPCRSTYRYRPARILRRPPLPTMKYFLHQRAPVQTPKQKPPAASKPPPASAAPKIPTATRSLSKAKTNKPANPSSGTAPTGGTTDSNTSETT